MKKTLSNFRKLIGVLLIALLPACSFGPDKTDHPIPSAPPTCLLPLFGHIYGKPKEIRETIVSDRKPRETIITLDWGSRKGTCSSPNEIIYLDTDLRPDSTVSTDDGRFVHYLKTPYYEYYISFSHTKESGEYHFRYVIDTVNRQVREIKRSHPKDTSEYTVDYFSQDGFLIHRFVKINNKDYYHLYYTNDNYGNPVEERIVIKYLDFIQVKYSYEYDKEGNWVAKDLYHYYQDGQSFKMQFRRKITY